MQRLSLYIMFMVNEYEYVALVDLYSCENLQYLGVGKRKKKKVTSATINSCFGVEPWPQT
jgi:hypothetical protein